MHLGPGHYGYGWFVNKAFNGGKKNESITVIEHGGGINNTCSLKYQLTKSGGC
jgi:hypothetical protein